jgi:hypothetical protein
MLQKWLRRRKVLPGAFACWGLAITALREFCGNRLRPVVLCGANCNGRHLAMLLN